MNKNYIVRLGVCIYDDLVLIRPSIFDPFKHKSTTEPFLIVHPSSIFPLPDDDDDDDDDDDEG